MKSLFVTLLTSALVSGHGYMGAVTINGQAYNGNVPTILAATTNNPSIIRKVGTYFPNKGASNPALTCGPNSTTAALVADANPGDSLAFSWKGALGNWIHDIGPMMTYMANCGSTPCNQFDITNAKWFKIQQVGRTSPGSSTWVQADVMNGNPATASLPTTLAPGNYLLRHEIIALHVATSLGGAEFYPACAQIKVGGSQTGAPTPDELVSIPGAYRDDDLGIYDPQIFNASAPYIFPGPPVAKFVGATTSGTSSNVTSTSGHSSTPTTSSTTPPATTSQASSNMCRIKKASPTSATEVVVQPRHFSRIMRGRSWY